MDVGALYSDDAEQRMQPLLTLRHAPEAHLRAALPHLIRFMYSATVDELVIVTQLLHGTSDRRAVEALVRMTEHPDARVRAAAEHPR